MKCPRCGRDEELYLRRYSGEVLCRVCLKKSILNKIRRTVGKHDLLERSCSLAYLKLHRPYDDLALDIFLDMERRFPEVSVDIIDLPDVGMENISVHLQDLIDYALSSGYDRVVIPAFLEDAVMLFVRYIYTGSPELMFIDGVGYVMCRRTDPPIVSPFIEVMSEELTYLVGADEKLTPMMKFVRELERDTPGALYNMYHSYHVLLKNSLNLS